MRKIYKPVVIVTAVMLSLTACGGKEEPVVSETAIEEAEKSSEPEESREDTTSSETESPTGEESPEDIESEADTTQEEEIAENQSESDLGYEIIPMDDTVCYATQSANLRSGPGTQYDIVGSLSYAQEIVVDGKVEKDGKQWFVLQSDTEEKQMVSGTLVVYQKPQQTTKPSGNTSNSTGNTGNTTQPSGGDTQPSGNNETPADEGGATGTTDNPWGGVSQDSSQLDWSFSHGNEWH